MDVHSDEAHASQCDTASPLILTVRLDRADALSGAMCFGDEHTPVQFHGWLAFMGAINAALAHKAMMPAAVRQEMTRGEPDPT